MGAKQTAPVVKIQEDFKPVKRVHRVVTVSSRCCNKFPYKTSLSYSSHDLDRKAAVKLFSFKFTEGKIPNEGKSDLYVSLGYQKDADWVSGTWNGAVSYTFRIPGDYKGLSLNQVPDNLGVQVAEPFGMIIPAEALTILFHDGKGLLNLQEGCEWELVFEWLDDPEFEKELGRLLKNEGKES